MDVGAVVGLHVVDNQIVGPPAFQNGFDIVHPLVGEILIDRIHDGNFLIEDRIGVVGHTVGDNVLAFKQVDIMVIHADVTDIFCNGHKLSPFVILICLIIAYTAEKNNKDRIN